MIEVKVSNLLNALCWLHDNVNHYHRGYIEDMGVNQDNNYNVDLYRDKPFPALLWLPGEGTWGLKDFSNGGVLMELRLFDLSEVNNDGDLKMGDTYTIQWNRLKVYLTQILREFKKGKFASSGVRSFWIDGDIEWFEDVEVMQNVLVYVGVKFNLKFNEVCDDFDFDFGLLPSYMPYPISDSSDYEELRDDSSGSDGDEVVGEIDLFVGLSVPDGWLECDGRLLNVGDYRDLYAVVGVRFGGVVGENFNLPDMRGRVVVGAGEGFGLSSRSVGDRFGAEEVILNSDQVRHDHEVSGRWLVGAEGKGSVAASTPVDNFIGDYLGFYSGSLNGDVAMNEDSLELTVGSAGVEVVSGHGNIQPSLSMKYIIKYQN